jgi:hypothetical protein
MYCLLDQPTTVHLLRGSIYCKRLHLIFEKGFSVEVNLMIIVSTVQMVCIEGKLLAGQFIE